MSIHSCNVISVVIRFFAKEIVQVMMELMTPSEYRYLRHLSPNCRLGRLRAEAGTFVIWQLLLRFCEIWPGLAMGFLSDAQSQPGAPDPQ